MPGTGERRRLAELGMTQAEIALWRALAAVGERLAALPALHPMGEHEAAHALARIQDLLLSRPGLRAQGWGLPDDEIPDAAERRARLGRFGMTEPEIALWYDLADVAGRMLELPDPSGAGNEQHELVHGLHRVQDQLLARAGRRAVAEPPG